MLEASFAGTLQACHAARVVALAAHPAPVACLPQSVAWFAASGLA
jgi:hypothetical protein